MNSQTAFFVGNIPVFGNLILSPMDGLSERPFRSLVRKSGSAMSYTEFINAIDVLSGIQRVHKKISYYESERPVVFQIFDDDPDRILDAARQLIPFQPDIIDLNMGCSAHHVAGRGAGAGLLPQPHKVAAIIQNLVKNLPVPVTAKIRLGWDDHNRNYLEIARIVEDCGAQLIAVHGRTKAQGYTGRADWDAIAEIKSVLRIPVIANGDVQTVTDIQRIQAHTRCDGVMIGRAALFNPWIFSYKDREEVSHREVKIWIDAHLEEMIQFHGIELGLILFRKYLKRLLSPYQISDEFLLPLLTETDFDRFKNQIDHLFKNVLEQKP
ncbi:tRNA dihydrouridine synthase [Bellilinea caldifistulae]|nr:tRNA-dihydrouridine synthase family protein [Bellilinea caldifistulae]